VAKKMSAGKWTNPVLLAPFDKKADALQVIIETPKGSRNKYAFDEDQGIFLLKRVLPAGMAFPYDFGFVPRTRAEDGDPTDVLVLMDEPAFVGCLLQCRIIGIIEGEQGRKKERERNDRVVAIEMDNHSFADVKHVDDLGKHRERAGRIFRELPSVKWQGVSHLRCKRAERSGTADQRRNADVQEGIVSLRTNGKAVFSKCANSGCSARATMR
jgi:inorganic pyrophosphatase